MDTEKKETVTEMPLWLRGHAAAKRFLDGNGFKILEDDYSCKKGEIDFVAMDGEDCLCFIDVHTRRVYGDNLDFPSVYERKRLENIAAYYLMAFEHEGDLRIRFDMISILALNEGSAFLRFHKNALGIG